MTSQRLTTPPGGSGNDAIAAIGQDVVNFRDFGGLQVTGGGTIVSGRLFRSGHLGAVTPPSAALLDAMRLSTVADLRFPKEREEAPSTWPAQNCPVERLEIIGAADSEGPHIAVLRSGLLDPAAIDRFYIEFYRTIPFDPNFQALFRAIAARSAAGHDGLLIHCSVGKDRTGIFVALIHHILGVSHEDIVADYMKTREAAGLQGMIPEIAERLRNRLGQAVPDAIARKMLGVEQDYIVASLAGIVQQSGSLASFFSSIGVDEDMRKAIRNTLIVQAG